jgi:hypothetical protein
MSTTPPTPTSFTPPPSSDRFAPTEWSQQSVVTGVMSQKGLLIGVGVALAALFVFLRRPASQEKAARQLVRDIRHVDDAGDIRDLLGSTLPPIVRPVLLLALEELERQVHRGFLTLEHQIEDL